MKGIILAGGAGTRLYPLTAVTSKQLLPIYDKPMIYYPLTTLMLAGIREILIISTPEDIDRFRQLLGNGEAFGLKLSYCIQAQPDGIAQAFILGKNFIGNDSCTLILGDNIFLGEGFTALLGEASKNSSINGRATVFGYFVKNPGRFGVVEFDTKGKALSVEEKPEHPKSYYAITGLYFFPSGVAGLAEDVKPSKRGELEITSLIEMYLTDDKLDVKLLGRSFFWMDAGTIESLMDASEMVKMMEERQGMILSAPEEVAYRKGWIDKDKLEKSVLKYGKTAYGAHLQMVLESKVFSIQL